MSIEAINAVAKMDIQPSGRKFVLLALANFADEDWACFPSIGKLAAWTSQGQKTVRDHLLALEEGGLIHRERQRRGDGMLGVYRFYIQRQFSPVADFASGEKQPEPVANFAAHNHQDKPSTNKSVSAGAKAELEKVLPPDLAQAVIDHRKLIRKPLTAKAAQLLAREFAKCENPASSAETMIQQGWQGFKADWSTEAIPRKAQYPHKKRTFSDAIDEMLENLENERSEVEGFERVVDLIPANSTGR